ncbi:hypothetical protein LCGC14_1403280 [marine sediment metagenome]|uniref:Calcineurin-like phosphoesterase domain-containing protein n=1 Tax=marine sediment metagenome TaxID=412755 RepID=A0A0F9JWQ1_9ZZZZ
MEKRTIKADDVMFTSDTHFGHGNIIKHCDRPYKDAYHMDEALVENWNAVVRPDQTVIHAGDFAFKGSHSKLITIAERLNGGIILVQGNHDHRKTLSLFHEVHDLLDLRIILPEGGTQRIIVCHYRMTVWPASHHGAWHVHGHSHGTLPQLTDKPVLDIGVDAWAMQPIDFATVALEMRRHML